MVGPRGSGKTTYSQEVVQRYPNVILWSRDKVVQGKFGKVMFRKDDPALEEAMEYADQQLKSLLRSADDDACIILDLPIKMELRKELIDFLRTFFGPIRIVCWYFTTSYDICSRWFFKKPWQERLLMDQVCYRLEYQYARLHLSKGVDYPGVSEYCGPNPDGFNLIRRIDPSNSNQEICFP